MYERTHGEEVGAAFGLLADGCGCVGTLGDIDAQLLLAGAGGGGHGRRVVTQTASTVAGLHTHHKNPVKQASKQACDTHSLMGWALNP